MPDRPFHLSGSGYPCDTVILLPPCSAAGPPPWGKEGGGRGKEVLGQRPVVAFLRLFDPGGPPPGRVRPSKDHRTHPAAGTVPSRYALRGAREPHIAAQQILPWVFGKTAYPGVCRESWD